MSRFGAAFLFTTLLVPVATSEDGVVPLKGHSGTVSCVAYSRDGKFLASGAKDGTLIVWGVATRKPLHQIPGHKDMVVTAAFSPDGKLLAATSHAVDVQ